MFNIGDKIKVPDGRIGILVYNGLDGQGIIWREEFLTKEEIKIISDACPLFSNGKPKDYPEDLVAKAMLRNKKLSKLFEMECVGEEWECELINE